MDAALEAELEALYAGPLDAFVKTRDALVATLKKAGDKEGAAAVKARARPTVSAWAVNRLWRSARADFEALLAAGEDLREAQRSALSGGGGEGMKRALASRRSAVSKLLARAKDELEGGGHPASAATLQRIESTLHTVATMGERGQLGQMTGDVGDDGLEGLLAAGGAASLAPHHEPAARREPEAKPPPRHAPVEPAKHARPAAPQPATSREDRERERALKKAHERADAAKGAYAVAEEASRGAKRALHDAEKKKTSGRAAVDEGKADLRRAEEALRDARLALDAAEKAARITDREADVAARAIAEADRALDRARVERDAAVEAVRAAKA
jgi:hypothetical protein